jgi:hypothetical protein
MVGHALRLTYLAISNPLATSLLVMPGLVPGIHVLRP